uniref:Thioredoxin domain-containing protein n=1 Tax=Syphacia muris TaxID=451379 RepID=A0A0N5AEP6_9BILA
MVGLKILKKEELDDAVQGKDLTVVYFFASWSDACKQLENILEGLQNELKCFKLVSVNAEDSPAISQAFGISAVPALLLFKSGKEVDRHNGFNPTEMRSKILTYSFPNDNMERNAEKIAKNDLESRIKELINRSRLMLFMKGTPDAPRCGFSRQMVELLRGLKANFGSFDILEDEEIRQGLKTYSNWQTYPQLYLDGELLGGLDVIREEIKDSAFVDKLPKTSL